jgi:hypothetical protein
MFKDKILAELRKKYPGLAANVLGLLSEKLEPTVTEEGQIETAVAGLENLPIKPQDLAAFLQKEGDRRVTEALKKKVEPTPPKDDPAPKDDPTDQSSALAKQLAALSAKLEAIEKKESQKTVTDQLHAKLREKKIPVQFASGIQIQSVEELDAAVQQAEATFTEVRQEMVNEGLVAALPKPGGSGGFDPQTKNVAAVDAEIKAWAEKAKAQQKV